MFLCAFVTLIECCSDRYRSWIGATKNLPFVCGEVLVGVLAIYIKDWRMLAVPIYTPLLASLAVFWFMPESPRWLYAVGKTDKAKAMLLQAAAINNVSITIFADYFSEIQLLKYNFNADFYRSNWIWLCLILQNLKKMVKSRHHQHQYSQSSKSPSYSRTYFCLDICG